MRENINLKIISALIALILYFFVHGQSNRTEIRLTVPIEFKNLPKNKYILKPVIRQAEVTLRGPSRQVSSGASSSPVFTVKIPDNPDNKYEFNLTHENIQLPNLVEAYGINPSKIEVVLDDVIERSLPVAVPRIGSLPETLRLVGINSDPAQIVISGPASEVSKVRSIKTEPLDMRDIAASGSYQLKLEHLSELITASSDTVSVSVDVAMLTAEKKFENLLIEIRGPANQLFKLGNSKVNLEVSGPKSLVSALKAEQITVFVKIPSDFKGTRMLPIEVDIPEDISILSLSNREVLVSAIK